MLSPNLINIINFFIFQFGWLVIVYYHNVISAIIGFGFTLINYVVIRGSYKEIALGVGIAFLGVLNDFIIAKMGFVSFSNSTIMPVPLWLVSVWLLFMSTFSSSLTWLTRVNTFYLAVLGALAGGTSYFVGDKLGALVYHHHILPQFVFYALNWFFLFPFIFILYHHIRNKF